MAGNTERADGEQQRAEAAGWERTAPGVLRKRLPRWDATVGAVLGRDALLVVDTGSSLREGARIRSELHGIFGVPVTHVALTHPHFDHVLGTAVFSGVRVYGAVGAAELLPRTHASVLHDAVVHGLDPAEAEEAVDVLVAPQHSVCDELTLDVGGRRVLLANVGPGHTAHDLAVLVPGGGDAREVVFCGDLVEESGEPQAGPDAQPAHWPAALTRLLDLGGEDAAYVPGHGAVVDAAFVRAQRDALAQRSAG